MTGGERAPHLMHCWVAEGDSFPVEIGKELPRRRVRLRGLEAIGGAPVRSEDALTLSVPGVVQKASCFPALGLA